MNKEIATRWTAALRSGQYEQGRGLLSASGKFCCLGVLCEIAVDDGIITKEEGDDYVDYGPEGDGLVLPSIVMKWAGMWSATGEEEGRLGASLSELNDMEQRTFDQIADHIDGSVDML